jgi:hypothetical protein
MEAAAQRAEVGASTAEADKRQPFRAADIELQCSDGVVKVGAGLAARTWRTIARHAVFTGLAFVQHVPRPVKQTCAMLDILKTNLHLLYSLHPFSSMELNCSLYTGTLPAAHHCI